MAYINSTRTVVNNVGTDIALAGAGNLFTVSGSLGGTKSLTLSDGFINNGAPEANLIVPLLFPNGHNDLGPSLYLEITVAGVTNPIPVVSNQNGTLLPIPHHEMLEGGSTVYKVVDPNTILNVYYTADYDGSQNPAFVVVGNPLVLSSSTYSIYANGYNDFVNNCELSDWEDASISNNSSNPTEIQYDGVICFGGYNSAWGSVSGSVSINGISFTFLTPGDIGRGAGNWITYEVSKGDMVYVTNDMRTVMKARWYKKRDYSNR